MSQSAGLFELLAYHPPGWGKNLLEGAISTLEISICAYAVGLALGLGGALGKLTGGRSLRIILDAYTTLVRALPELLLIVMFYYLGTDTLNRAAAEAAARLAHGQGLVQRLYTADEIFDAPI